VRRRRAGGLKARIIEDDYLREVQESRERNRLSLALDGPNIPRPSPARTNKIPGSNFFPVLVSG
jgi:hypothetical protein